MMHARTIKTKHGWAVSADAVRTVLAGIARNIAARRRRVSLAANLSLLKGKP
jgi:hypothetical protein